MSNTTSIGLRILDELKAVLGDAWARVTPEDRKLLARIAEDAARIGVARAAGWPVAEGALDHLAAQLANVKSAGAALTRDALLDAAGRVFGTALEVFVKRI